nr:MAG TPA: hypothetical protein [Caudoviricetes sp.]
MINKYIIIHMQYPFRLFNDMFFAFLELYII